MSDEEKSTKRTASEGIKFATVGALCAVCGALISIRIYAGLPERVEKVEVKVDRNAERITEHESWSRDTMISLTGDLREMKAMIQVLLEDRKAQRAVAKSPSP